MSLALHAIGTATPPRRIRQADAARLAASFSRPSATRARALEAIYRQTRIDSRGSVLLEDPGEEPYAQSFFPPAGAAPPGGPTTADRMARYAAEAGGLAIAAARSAIAAAAIPPDAITHLVTCSCTGFANPGVDLEIVAALELPAHVRRTHVGFMGCHGAFNALGVAAAFAAADPTAVVLVDCVELCSLHFQYGSRSDHVVANSIFADGAAAVVGTGRDRGTGGWQLVRQWSRILPDSAGEMGWIIGNHGFEMSLSARVPGIIGREIRGLVSDVLAEAGLGLGDVPAWAVHPGGPRVVADVQEALGLADDQVAASRGVLAAHGNMSSATVLFILEQLLGPAAAAPCVAVAFGPGLTVEIALFDRLPPVRPR
jgi:alpha-pyrone synthase